MESEANTPQPIFPGAGASRQLLTQSGAEVALLQQCMLSEGHMYTATFDIEPPGVGIPFSALAIVTWSEGGNSVRREMSIVRGASITLPGRMVDIRVKDVTPSVLPISGGDTPDPDVAYWVFVVVCRGTRPDKSIPPTLYGGIASVAGHASMTVNIPDFAGVTSVEVSAIQSAAFPSAPPNVVVSAQAGAGIFKRWDPTIERGFVAIPPGATQLVITNADASNAALITLTYGVDG